MVAACSDGPDTRRRACEEARAQNRADAEQLCRRVGGSTGAAWIHGRRAPVPDSIAGASVRRGGFGLGGFGRGGG